MNQTDTRIRALSTKLKYFCRDDRAWPSYVDVDIYRDDLIFNLSPILTDLIIALMAPPVSLRQVDQIIADYNLANATTYSTQFFIEIGWIRYINEEYVIASAVGSHLWRLDKPDTFNPSNLPVEFREQSLCLLQVQRAIEKSHKTSLDEATLEKFIKSHNQNLSVDFFIEKGIVSKNAADRYFLNRQKNFTEQLRNRIASLAWFKFVDETPSLENFRKFLKFLVFLGSQPDKLEDFLSNDTIKKIRDFSLQMLSEEPDLQDPEKEVINDRLDADYTSRYKLSDPIPNYIFDTHDPYVFTKQVKFYRFLDQNLFFHHNSRVPYLILIKFLIQFDSGQYPFRAILDFFKKCNNPFIKAQIEWFIQHTYPEVLAHFLADLQLAPLAFNTIDNLEIKDEWLKNEDGYIETLKITNNIKDELWTEAFKIYLDQAIYSSCPADFGRGFAAILKDLAEKVFSFNNSTYDRSFILHQLYKKRYDYVLKCLSEARMAFRNHYPEPIIKPLLTAFVLPVIFTSLKEFPKFDSRTQRLSLNVPEIDLYIELLKLSGSDFGDEEVYNLAEPELQNLSEQLARQVFNDLEYYFTVTEVPVNRYYEESKIEKASRTSYDFGTEILDLAYLCIKFEEFGFLRQLEQRFRESLTFKPTKSNYDDHNREQLLKVSVFLKLLLLGYISLVERKKDREFEGAPVESVLRVLEELITNYSLKYSKNIPLEARLDVFSERQYFFTQDLYSQPLSNLLYKALNTFPVASASDFIDSYFDGNNDLEKMFKAVNRIDDKDIKAKLTEKIESIDCQEFIESAFTITELESALIEVVNSRALYRFATPFLKAIESHLKSSKINTPDKRLFLYRTKLLLALKNKDTTAILDLEIPKTDIHHTSGEADNEGIRKQFYLGLDQLYNHKNFLKAIEYFKSIHLRSPDNAEYAFYMYHAKAFYDLETGNHGDAKVMWDRFKESIPDGEKVKLSPFADASYAMDLLYYSWSRDDIRFDQIINTLPPLYLYQEPLIAPVYSRYLERGVPEIGYEYLNKAISYLRDNGIEVSEELEKLKLNAVSDKLIEQVRRIFGEIRNLPASAIPRVLPAALNNKMLLHEFILGEIISGLQIMRKKIKAVESIIKEDHYNDVFLATLRLKLPLFGWEIVDQERTGPSSTTLDAGEADIIIRGGGKDLAIMEALKMDVGNYPYLRTHIKKCVEYARDMKHYYIVVYYHGKRKNFSNFINTYQADVARIDYEPNWCYNSSLGFNDISKEFENSENIYISKTQHGTSKAQLFHVVVDLSQPDPLK